MITNSLKTANVVIVSVAVVVVIVAITIAAVIANDNADRRHTQMIQACVSAGHIWVRGDCVLNVGQLNR